MNARRPAIEAAIMVVREKVFGFEFDSDADPDDVDVDADVTLAPVFVAFAPDASTPIPVLVARERDAGKVVVAIENPDVIVLAKSLMTVGEPSEKTFESSLQHVLASELQQYRSPPHGTIRSYELL